MRQPHEKHGTSGVPGHDTVALIVTYGGRHQLAIEAAEAALRAGVRDVVLVNNGPPALATTASGPWVCVLQAARNAGSAAAINAGLRYCARQEAWRFAWILDDDNRPRGDALNELDQAWRQLASDGHAVILASHRPARVTMAEDAYDRLSRGSFGGFQVIAAIRQRMPLRRRGPDSLPASGSARTDCRRVGVLPYGGMLIPLDEARVLPDPQLIIYGDDTAFSLALRSHGWPLMLVGKSVVDDALPSGLRGPVQGSVLRTLFQAEEFRAYYSLRNQVFIDFHLSAGSTFRRIGNASLFLCIVTCYGVHGAALRRTVVLWRAALFGALGILGQQLALPEGPATTGKNCRAARRETHGEAG